MEREYRKHVGCLDLHSILALIYQSVLVLDVVVFVFLFF